VPGFLPAFILYLNQDRMRRAKIVPNDHAMRGLGRRRDGLGFKLDRYSRTPFYRQIYERISHAIIDGTLRQGERLPSVRSLASQLATSRGTIDLAYGLLSSDGYILTRGAAGTRVVYESPRPPQTRPGPRRTSPRGASSQPPGEYEPEVIPGVPFALGLPAFDAFPRKLWSRLTIRTARAFPLHQLNAPPAGYRLLREAIRSYLAVSRGIACSVDQLFVTSGFQSALGLITRALLHAGDEAWIEDPGYFMARLGLEEAGAKTVAVPVDAEGLDVRAGAKKSPNARFVFVTPSHQMPLGVSLSTSRRAALLTWAAKAGAWVIEDDYDSEFRYGSRPLPALKSLDDAERVLYIGTFSKVLFPGLRLGYLVVPESVADRLFRICQLLYRDRPIFDQAIVADFIKEGHFARHIKRMRELYAERRLALAEALATVFDGKIKIELQAGGMHLLARLADCSNDRDLVARAMAKGLVPAALSTMAVEHDCGHGLLLSFTNIQRDAAFGVALRLKQAIAAKP
jgi:GntR family transcriptional regulator / MocR family aminotransferase